MKLAIVAYPILDEADRRWIESFRAKHDPQARRIDVHFTLVFPVDAIPTELGPEIAMVAQSTEPIRFLIRGAKVVPDVLGDTNHIFLVPDEGAVQIAALHDRLYAGALRAHLRSDIPFVPHMTVGAAPDRQVGETLAESLSARSRMVRGTIGHLELVNVGTGRVQSLTTYAFGKPAASPPADRSE